MSRCFRFLNAKMFQFSGCADISDFQMGRCFGFPRWADVSDFNMRRCLRSPDAQMFQISRCADVSDFQMRRCFISPDAQMFQIFRCADVDIYDLANRILKTGLKYRYYGAERIAISSVLVRNYINLNKLIQGVNISLKHLCKVYGFDFISNDKIGKYLS